jgi:hypothetical protein
MRTRAMRSLAWPPIRRTSAERSAPYRSPPARDDARDLSQQAPLSCLGCMNVQIAQAKIRPEHVPAVRAAAARVFAALESAQVEDVGFAWLVLGDGETFVVVARVDEGARNPIPQLPEYQELQEGLKHWLAEPPDRQDLAVIGSYRLF